MSTKIQLRRDTATNWTNTNPILAEGEIGVELSVSVTTPSKFKIGDGITAWNILKYEGYMPITTLYIQDELQNDWELTSSTDGHIKSMLVGDLPENTKHHVIRDNFSLSDFVVDGSGGIVLVDKTVKQEYTKISATMQHEDYKNYLVDTTAGIVYIDISSEEVRAFTARDMKSNFDVNNCVIRIYDEFNTVIHTATLDKKNKGYIFYYDTNWNYGEVGKGLIIAIASDHVASADFIDAELQMDNMAEGSNTKIMTASELTKLANMADNGNVTFTIENVGGNETIKATAPTAEIYYAEDLTLTSTNSATYVDKMTSTKTVTAGTYLLNIYYDADSNTDQLDFFSEVTLDCTRLCNEMIFEFKEKTRTQYLPIYRRFKVTLTAGSHTIAVRYKSSDGIAISTISQVSITATKVILL